MVEGSPRRGPDRPEAAAPGPDPRPGPVRQPNPDLRPGLDFQPGSDVWLGLDVGTQSARCLAVSGSGEVLASAARPVRGIREGARGERHEQDPHSWWSALVGACREALSGIDRSRVRGLAVDATSGTILLATPDGTPLTPGLMYDDARATRQAERVNEVGGAVWRELGYRTMQPGWALPKLCWLLEHTAVPQGARLLHQADLVTWRLAGHPVASDASHALKTGYHLVDERWPGEVLDPLGVPHGLLPEVVPPGTPVGAVGADAARQTGIPEGTVIVAGTTDGCAAQIGAGALAPGAWNVVLGTTLVLKGASRHLVRDPGGVVYCHRGPDGLWLPGGASSSGAGVLSRWFPGADLPALTERAAERRGRTGRAAARRGHAAAPELDAVSYPLVGRGERFPFRALEAEPFTLGDPADEVERFHAALLGVAFVERLCFDYLDHLGAPVDGPLTLTGGGSRNAYWSRLRADVLGRRVTLPEQAESALGMAVLAATARGRTLTDAAAAMVHAGREVEPDRERTARHLPRYLAFVDELTHRGWLDATVADHAHERATP